MHPDNFVGNTASWWLNDRKAESPFFLQIGFPGYTRLTIPQEIFYQYIKIPNFNRTASQ